MEMLLKLAVRILTRNGPVCPPGDDVVAHLPEGVLGRHPGLALGHLDDAGHLGHDRPAGQGVEQLVDDLGGLARVLQPDPHPGEDVAVRVRPDLPVALVPGHRELLVAAEVPVDPRAPQVRGRQPVAERHLGRDHPDAPGAGLVDLVADQQRLHLVAEAPHLLHDGLGLVDPALGQVVLDAADAVEVGVEPAAGRPLDQVEDVLAVAEGVEDRGEGAEARTPRSPRNSETLAMRDSSKRTVRMCCARGGASTSISFSTAIHIGNSLLIQEEPQSIRRDL